MAPTEGNQPAEKTERAPCLYRRGPAQHFYLELLNQRPNPRLNSAVDRNVRHRPDQRQRALREAVLVTLIFMMV